MRLYAFLLKGLAAAAAFTLAVLIALWLAMSAVVARNGNVPAWFALAAAGVLLLETTDLPVDEVAARSGLGSGGSLRAHLHATAGVSPSAYRRTFRPPKGA